jgi:cullin 1
LQALDAELLARRQTELLEKEGSGCRVLLANDRYEDLSRLYRLFSRIPDGLVPVAEIFKAHITDLGESTAYGCCCCGCCGRSVVSAAHTACAV